MKSFSLEEISFAVGGQFVQGNKDELINSVSIDTRTLKKGDLFFALIGDRYDAHEYLEQAAEKGASGLVISRGDVDLPKEISAIKVPDTLAALTRLAAYNRQQNDTFVIGVTGSNGKTTTKDFIYTILSKKYPVLKNEGNLNNEIGLPLTLLQLNNHRFAVLEMGMRGLKQIDALCKIANINAGVITSIGTAHLELLGSIENIALAKGEILENVPLNGFALIPADKLAISQLARCKGKVYTFGLSSADYYADNIEVNVDSIKFIANTPSDSIDIKLFLLGKHNVSNAMAAIAVAENLGFKLNEIKEALLCAENPPMRLQVIECEDFTVINDTYNANPDSMKKSIDTLFEVGQGKRKIAILGDMLEIGSNAQQEHYEIGKTIKDDITLLTVGELAKHIADGARDVGLDKIFCCRDNQHAVDTLKKIVQMNDIILIKGSRSMRMEEIVKRIGCM